MVSGSIIGSLTLFFLVNHVLDRKFTTNPAIHGSLLGSPFWEHEKEIFNLETSPRAEPWVYYTIYAFFVFLFNIFDIVSFFLTLCSTIHLCAARQYFYNIFFP